MTCLAEFELGLVLTFFVWAVLVVMSFWIWKASRSATSLLTVLGALFLSMAAFLQGFGIRFTDSHWLPMVGSVLVVLGYYLTVKPIVDGHIRDIQAKRRAAAASGPPRS